MRKALAMLGEMLGRDLASIDASIGQQALAFLYCRQQKRPGRLSTEREVLATR